MFRSKVADFLGTNYNQEIHLLWFACLAPHCTCMKLGQHSPADEQSVQKPELFLLEMMSPDEPQGTVTNLHPCWMRPQEDAQHPFHRQIAYISVGISQENPFLERAGFYLANAT